MTDTPAPQTQDVKKKDYKKAEWKFLCERATEVLQHDLSVKIAESKVPREKMAYVFRNPDNAPVKAYGRVYVNEMDCRTDICDFVRHCDSLPKKQGEPTMDLQVVDGTNSELLKVLLAHSIKEDGEFLPTHKALMDVKLSVLTEEQVLLSRDPVQRRESGRTPASTKRQKK